METFLYVFLIVIGLVSMTCCVIYNIFLHKKYNMAFDIICKISNDLKDDWVIVKNRLKYNIVVTDDNADAIKLITKEYYIELQNEMKRSRT